MWVRGKHQIVVLEIISGTCLLNDQGVGKEKVWVDIKRIISWAYLFFDLLFVFVMERLLNERYHICYIVVCQGFGQEGLSGPK